MSEARKDESKFSLKLFILFSRSFVVLLFVFFFIVLIFCYVRHNCVGSHNKYKQKPKGQFPKLFLAFGAEENASLFEFFSNYFIVIFTFCANLTFSPINI